MRNSALKGINVGTIVFLLLVLSFPGGDIAGAATGMSIGKITVTFSQVTYSGSDLKLSGGVHFSGSTFDLKAASILVETKGGKGPGGVSSATADGDPATGQQIVGRFDQTATGRTFYVYADHAVYTPFTGVAPGVSSPPTGKVDFTGHVSIEVHAPEALAEPSITHLDHAVVYVGSGSDFPLVVGGPGVTVLTPLH